MSKPKPARKKALSKEESALQREYRDLEKRFKEAEKLLKDLTAENKRLRDQCQETSSQDEAAKNRLRLLEDMVGINLQTSELRAQGNVLWVRIASSISERTLDQILKKCDLLFQDTAVMVTDENVRSIQEFPDEMLAHSGLQRIPDQEAQTADPAADAE